MYRSPIKDGYYTRSRANNSVVNISHQPLSSPEDNPDNGGYMDVAGAVLPRDGETGREKSSMSVTISEPITVPELSTTSTSTYPPPLYAISNMLQPNTQHNDIMYSYTGTIPKNKTISSATNKHVDKHFLAPNPLNSNVCVSFPACANNKNMCFCKKDTLNSLNLPMPNISVSNSCRNANINSNFALHANANYHNSPNTNAFVNVSDNRNTNNSVFAPSCDLSHVYKSLPTFDGHNMHPVTFIRRLEHIMVTCRIELQQMLCWSAKIFAGEAGVWAEAIFDTYVDFDAFKADFLEHFWGSLKQLEVRSVLESSKHRSGEGNYTNYFLKLVAQCRYLTPPYPEPLLISMLARHFPTAVAATLIGVQSLPDAIARLRQADFIVRPLYEARSQNWNNNRPRQSNNNNTTHNNYTNNRSRVACLDVDVADEEEKASENFQASTC